MEMNGCEIRKRQNKHLSGIKCCDKCHRFMDNVETDEDEGESTLSLCCSLWTHENAYRPSIRKVNELTS
jgi:hypothetical protein